jgi:uncharacterized protein (DUF433 family)
MTIQAVIPSHITIDDKGVARIDNSRFKVIHLIEAMKASQSTAEQLCADFPQLTKPQIHSALAYYYDHQSEIDADIERGLKEYDEMMATREDSPGRKKLRALGHIP